jgi:hypothetical protein
MKKYLVILILISIALCLCSCTIKISVDILPEEIAYRKTKTVSYNEIVIDVIIDKPKENEVDVLVVFHGTVVFDDKIMEASNRILDEFKSILDRDDIMIISVLYPEENLLIGDNLIHAETALLWLKNDGNKDLGITIKKIFLGGHSQGGYIATRLNTMHQTDGVIVNAPGPLNLGLRCQLEIDRKIPVSTACVLMNQYYDVPSVNWNDYFIRSLLNFTKGFKSDILLIQGLNDTPIQMYSWSIFKEEVTLNHINNIQVIFLELDSYGHQAIFRSNQAKEAFNQFINDRSCKYV